MWEVGEHGLAKISNGSFITWDEFELLTGRKRLSPIKGRTITINRDKGHVHFYDTKFIPYERYKQGGYIYICRIVSEEDGTGLFEPVSKELKVVLTKDLSSMEIA